MNADACSSTQMAIATPSSTGFAPSSAPKAWPHGCSQSMMSSSAVGTRHWFWTRRLVIEVIGTWIETQLTRRWVEVAPSDW